MVLLIWNDQEIQILEQIDGFSLKSLNKNGLPNLAEKGGAILPRTIFRKPRVPGFPLPPKSQLAPKILTTNWLEMRPPQRDHKILSALYLAQFETHCNFPTSKSIQTFSDSIRISWLTSTFSWLISTISWLISTISWLISTISLFRSFSVLLIVLESWSSAGTNRTRLDTWRFKETGFTGT